MRRRVTCACTPSGKAGTISCSAIRFEGVRFGYPGRPEIYAGLERIPSSLLEASGDLGARSPRTFRKVILPLVLPAVVAGSIFTFSLTLGDYITPTLVSGTQFIGNVVYSNISVNRPLAAAYALVPIAIMVVYLLVARRLGAFEEL